MAEMGKQKVVIRLRKKKFFNKKRKRLLNFFSGTFFDAEGQLHYYSPQLSNFDTKFMFCLVHFLKITFKYLNISAHSFGSLRPTLNKVCPSSTSSNPCVNLTINTYFINVLL